MYRVTTSCVALFMLVSLQKTIAHPGRLDASGCHHDRRSGGYHCHSGSSPRRNTRAKASQQSQAQTLEDFDNSISHDEEVRLQTALSESRPGEGEYRAAKNAMIQAGCWSEIFDSTLVRETIGRRVKMAGLSGMYRPNEATPLQNPAQQTYAPEPLADGFNCCAQRAGITVRVTERPASLFCVYPQEDVSQCILNKLNAKGATVFSSNYELGKELDSASYLQCGDSRLFCGFPCKQSVGRVAVCIVLNNGADSEATKYRAITSCRRPPPERVPEGWTAWPGND